MKRVTLPHNQSVPALGLGTWGFGDRRETRDSEIAAIELALTMGYRLIDTAEMYGSGGAEEIIGIALERAITQRITTRDDVFIVSKVYPHNASRQGVIDACARTLDRRGVAGVDLYLLPWRGRGPRGTRLRGFERRLADGRSRRWGVSNFEVEGSEELWRLPGGSACAANPVYYPVSERGVEFDVVPWQRQ